MKKRMIAVFFILGLSCVYGLSFWVSLRKVDEFCNAIDGSTKMSDLRSLAQRIRVDLVGPFAMSNSNGDYLSAFVVSGFTMGEYGCSIRGDVTTQKIISKHLHKG